MVTSETIKFKRFLSAITNKKIEEITDDDWDIFIEMIEFIKKGQEELEK